MLDEDRNKIARYMNQKGILENNCRNKNRDQQLARSGDVADRCEEPSRNLENLTLG